MTTDYKNELMNNMTIATTGDRDKDLYYAIVWYGFMNKLISKKIKVPDRVLNCIKKNNIKFKGDDYYKGACSYTNKNHKKHTEFKKEVEGLFVDIEEVYRIHKKANKYISAEFGNQEDKKEIKDFLYDLKIFMCDKEKSLCFYYNIIEKGGSLQWLDKKTLYNNFKVMKQFIKNKGGCELSKKTYKIDKKDWYVILVSGSDDDANDEVLLKLFGEFKRGTSFWFYREDNRDAMYEYLLK